MSCSICQHPQRREIDRALLAGSVAIAALSQQYGLSPAALKHHQAHLQAKVARAQEPLRHNLLQGCLFWLTQALEMTMQTAQAAQAESNHKLVLQALSQGTRISGLILKQDCQLAPEVVYEILAAPPGDAQNSLLPHDPQILAASRQALAAAFAAPCPETAAAAPSAASPADLELLQQLLPNLAAPKTSSPKRPTLREKGGKLPGITAPGPDFAQASQDLALYNIITAGFDLSQPSRYAAGAPGNLKLETSLAQALPTDKPLSEHLYEQQVQGCHNDQKTGRSGTDKPHHPAPGRGATRSGT